MLDAQNQGPQCTACGSPMRLAAIEPSMPGQTCERFPAHDAREFSGTSSTALSLKRGQRQDGKVVSIFDLGQISPLAVLRVMLPVIERGQSMDGTRA